MTRSDPPAGHRSDPPATQGADGRAGRGKHRGLPVLLVTVATLGAVQAAAWFYFRAKQPVTDELTRERLQPRSDM
jgi:hypothetical protein